MAADPADVTARSRSVPGGLACRPATADGTGIVRPHRTVLAALLGVVVAGDWPARPLHAADAAPLSLGRVIVDPRRRTVYMPARLNQTNGVIEYALVTDYGKTHESLLITEAGPRDLQGALLLLNLQPAGPGSLAAHGSADPAPASALEISVAWSTAGQTNRLALEKLIGLVTGGGADLAGAITGHLAPGPWLFNGSTFSTEGFVAHFEGSIVSLIRDPGAVANSGRADQDNDDIHVPDPARLPPLGTAVMMEFTPATPLAKAPTPATPATPAAPAAPAVATPRPAPPADPPTTAAPRNVPPATAPAPIPPPVP